MAKRQTVAEPSADAERELNSILEDSADEVEVRGTRYKIKWMRNRTKRKITDIMLSAGDDDKVNSKCAAAIVLNGYFKITFLWWILWRWFYYVRQYSDAELIPLINLGKKKAQVEAYFAATMLLTEMRDTVMMMTREEVNRIRQESFGAQHGRLERSTNA